MLQYEPSRRISAKDGLDHEYLKGVAEDWARERAGA